MFQIKKMQAMWFEMHSMWSQIKRYDTRTHISSTEVMKIIRAGYHDLNPLDLEDPCDNSPQAQVQICIVG